MKRERGKKSVVLVTGQVKSSRQKPLGHLVIPVQAQNGPTTQTEIWEGDLVRALTRWWRDTRWVLAEMEKKENLVKSSCCTHFIVTSIEVEHLSLPILFLAFMTRDDRETVERAWGQGAARLGPGGYQNDQRDRQKESCNRYT